MQFSAAVISAITVAVASAATLGQRNDVLFKVSHFDAGCIPHSSQCRYSFSLIQPGTMETKGVQCTALVTSDNSLPSIGKWEGTCQDSSRTFWVVREADGLMLWASQPVTPASNSTASHLIPNSQIATTHYALGDLESYDGPKSFDMQAVYN
ncbi:hypothetical protein EAF04_002883 [Stromatinia cepivora]|nr:hypothetical protein EAF04_002883 [Stromatinia cepivora]